VCETCQAIDAGRYIDLLEIDAASNTGVDNVRELIDNAQYMPSRGRYKVYLIDEVHMLSKAAFNALLKTLEEPPDHVKFLFATTDPEKLLVTVLSRCLQFNLKRLDEEQIHGQMVKILTAEGITFEDGALTLLARAADGSLRDGLSLLDQAIAYAGGAVDEAAVARMLGTVDRTRIGYLLDALGQGDGARLMNEVATLAELSPDWNGVLSALSESLHRIQVRQLVPGVETAFAGIDLDALAPALRPELVQLWYQMALNARRDLPLAPSPRAGFEMAVLRMLAFRPQQSVTASPVERASSGPAKHAGYASGPRANGAQAAQPLPRSAGGQPNQTSHPTSSAPQTPSSQQAHGNGAPAAPPPAAAAATAPPLPLSAETWPEIIARLNLTGPVRELGAHAGFISREGERLNLSLPASDDHLTTPRLSAQLAAALAPQFGGTPPKLHFTLGAAAGSETLHQRTARDRDQAQAAAEAVFLSDPNVQRLVSHGAEIVHGSIRPLPL